MIMTERRFCLKLTMYCVNSALNAGTDSQVTINIHVASNVIPICCKLVSCALTLAEASSKIASLEIFGELVS